LNITKLHVFTHPYHVVIDDLGRFFKVILAVLKLLIAKIYECTV